MTGSPLIFHPLFDGIIDYFDRLDLPAGVFGASLFGGNRAGGVSGIVKRKRAVGKSFAAARGQPAAIFENKQQIVDRTIAQAISQFYPVAIGNVAIGTDRPDIAFCHHRTGFPIPQDLIGTQFIPVSVENDIAFGRDEIILEIIGDGIGTKFDFIILRIRGNGGVALGLCHSRCRRHSSQGQGKKGE